MLRRILLVEDDASIRVPLAEILEIYGYAVALAENGRAAIELLRAGPPPDVILTDLTMPVMGGLELIEALGRAPEWAGIPVIVVSAVGTKTIVGARCVIPKPFDLEDIHRALHSISSVPVAVNS
jgi:two-component system chemotaxis response regulator CheY